MNAIEPGYHKGYESKAMIGNYTFIVNSYHVIEEAPTISGRLLGLIRSKVIRSLAKDED